MVIHKDECGTPQAQSVLRFAIQGSTLVIALAATGSNLSKVWGNIIKQATWEWLCIYLMVHHFATYYDDS
ncbi:MAG: hypothetical protein WAK17_15655 [Candidatus Nitrosopolaris sp.]